MKVCEFTTKVAQLFSEKTGHKKSPEGLFRLFRLLDQGVNFSRYPFWVH